MKKKISVLLILLTFSLTTYTQSEVRPCLPLRSDIHTVVPFESTLPAHAWNTHVGYKNCHMKTPAFPESGQSFLSFQIIDSLLGWKWDPVTIGWKINTRTINLEYDASLNLIHKAVESLAGNGVWAITSQTTYTYDAHHNLLTELNQLWDGQAWINNYEFIYTYNEYNNQTSEIDNYWSDGALTYSAKAIYMYDSLQNQIGYERFVWEETDWSLESRATYFYDPYQNITRAIYQTWSNGTLVYTTQGLLTYDPNHYLIRILYQNWDEFNQEWHTINHYIYTYDAQYHLIRIFGQTWDGLSWNSFSQQLFTYGENDNPNITQYQSWIGNVWVNKWKAISTYDPENNLTGTSYFQYNSSGTEVMTGDSTHYYFHIVTATKDQSMEDGNILVYPNPSSGKITIKNSSALEKVEVYSLQGQLIYSFNEGDQNASLEINLEGYGPGIYMIRIHESSRTHTRKIVLQ